MNGPFDFKPRWKRVPSWSHFDFSQESTWEKQGVLLVPPKTIVKSGNVDWTSRGLLTIVDPSSSGFFRYKRKSSGWAKNMQLVRGLPRNSSRLIPSDGKRPPTAF